MTTRSCAPQPDSEKEPLPRDEARELVSGDDLSDGPSPEAEAEAEAAVRAEALPAEEWDTPSAPAPAPETTRGGAGQATIPPDTHDPGPSSRTSRIARTSAS